MVYGKFIEVWRQKEAALKKSQLTRLLLANASHEGEIITALAVAPSILIGSQFGLL